jgi:exonuclease SbcD
MRILHTSDWHLGRALYGRKRYEEFASFLDWLLLKLDSEQVDILLVAGDVFDNTTPSNRSQELYYRFLCRVAQTGCRHVVVTGGNHDSPSFLNAPRELLRAMNVHVVGSKTENIADEVLVLCNKADEPELIVCAVPYLRDREIRTSEAGESITDKENRLLAGIKTHYEQVCQEAEKQRQNLGADIPLIVMGHLFTAGGSTVEGDGVRELYVGSIAHVNAGIFPANIDYLALGHLHSSQLVGGSEFRRYCGSPLPMSFGECKREKSVLLLEFTGREKRVQKLVLPVWQELESIKGDWNRISERLQTLREQNSKAWLEMVYDGVEAGSDLQERLTELVAGTQMEILRIRNQRVFDQVLLRSAVDESLDDLKVEEVFERRLESAELAEEERIELRYLYNEIVRTLQEEDIRSE